MPHFRQSNSADRAINNFSPALAGQKKTHNRVYPFETQPYNVSDSILSRRKRSVYPFETRTYNVSDSFLLKRSRPLQCANLFQTCAIEEIVTTIQRNTSTTKQLNNQSAVAGSQLCCALDIYIERERDLLDYFFSHEFLVPRVEQPTQSKCW